MSATPPNGPSRPAPNGQPNAFVKRKPVGVDPLVQKKGPVKYRPPPVKRAVSAAPNGHAAPTPPGSRIPAAHPAAQQPLPYAQKPKSNIDVSGFSDPKVTEYQDFKLVTTKRQLLEGLRHHVMNLTANQNLDIQNEEAFTRPVRLHRRDPRAPPPGQQAKQEEEEPPKDANKQEQEAYFARKAERQKEREANLAQIAPSTQPGKKMRNFARKTEQVFRPSQSADQQTKYRDKYEEKLPWHLEDFNEKHCLVGSHQQTMSHLYAALVLEPDPTGQAAGQCRILPVEKWYKFGAPRTVQSLSLEEVEKAMKKQKEDPRYGWLERGKMEDLLEKQKEEQARQAKRLYSAPTKDSLVGSRLDDGGGDLDFEDDFADDEEGNVFGDDKDEDQKLAEERIKKEMLKANIFDHREEKEVDMEELREQRMKENQGKYTKKLNKALRKREGNFNVGSDSDEDNPYATDSSESDSEAERIKKEEEEAKAREEKPAQGESGASTKGTNTPSGRKEKHGTGSDRDIITKKIKGRGSPNLSDIGSGTDASVRKKTKKLGKTSTGSSTPIPGSRPSLPLESKKRKVLAPGGAGSDSEGGRGGGGALSDAAGSDGGSKIKRLKLNPPGGSVSPTATPPPTSRAGSPTAGGGMPSIAELKAAIPADGIGIMVLYKQFKPRISDAQRPAFWKLVQQAGKVNKEAKWVAPR